VRNLFLNLPSIGRIDRKDFGKILIEDRAGGILKLLTSAMPFCGTSP